jgi:hypothetical protein
LRYSHQASAAESSTAGAMSQAENSKVMKFADALHHHATTYVDGLSADIDRHI